MLASHALLLQAARPLSTEKKTKTKFALDFRVCGGQNGVQEGNKEKAGKQARTGGSMAILTEEMILAKTRCKDLERVRLMFAVAPTVFLGVTKLVFVSSRFQKPQHVRQRSRGREHLEGENT